MSTNNFQNLLHILLPQNASIDANCYKNMHSKRNIEENNGDCNLFCTPLSIYICGGTEGLTIFFFIYRVVLRTPLVKNQ